MPFTESIHDYEAKLRRFAEKHPDATEDDLKALFPKMTDVSAIWAKFNGEAKAHAAARTKGGN